MHETPCPVRFLATNGSYVDLSQPQHRWLKPIAYALALAKVGYALAPLPFPPEWHQGHEWSLTHHASGKQIRTGTLDDVESWLSELVPFQPDPPADQIAAHDAKPLTIGSGRLLHQRKRRKA